MDEPLVKNEDGEPAQKQVRNLTYVQERAKDAMGAGPWCDLPDDTLLRSPWTNLLFQGLTEEGLDNTPSLQFDQEDATVGTPLRNRVWGGVPVVARAAASSFTDDKPFLV